MRGWNEQDDGMVVEAALALESAQDGCDRQEDDGVCWENCTGEELVRLDKDERAEVMARHSAVLPRRRTVLRNDIVGLRDGGGGEFDDAGADGAAEPAGRYGVAGQRFVAVQTVDAKRAGAAGVTV